jgi:tRNA modification GTPase
VRATVAAIATPPGSGALGIVRVTGPKALSLVEALTGQRAFEARRATFVRIPDVDQAVVTYYPAENSPTGEDLVEITAHGSPYILAEILKRLGAEAAPPGEFTRRAYLAGKMDLAQAEAVCDLINASSKRAHRAALNQLEGGLSSRVAGIRRPLFELLVQVEACLDHPEEDIPKLSLKDIQAALSPALDFVELLITTWEPRGLDAPRICLVGRPNAGKSSLLNALLGKDRAIVASEPGTTRDTLEEPWQSALLVDTAGLRETSSPSEAEGVKRARQSLSSSELALLIIDSSQPESAEDASYHDEVLSSGVPVMLVLSKSDLPSVSPRVGVSVSVKNGDGLPELRHMLEHALSGKTEGPVVVSARHHELLLAAAAELRGALADAGKEDLLASRLRGALRNLDEITGAGAHDEALAAVFARFCVGK